MSNDTVIFDNDIIIILSVLMDVVSEVELPLAQVLPCLLKVTKR